MAGREILHQQVHLKETHHREIKAEIEQRLVQRQVLAVAVQALRQPMSLEQPPEQEVTGQQVRRLHLLMVPLALVEAQAQDGFLAGAAVAVTQVLVGQVGLEVAQRGQSLPQVHLRLLQIQVVVVVETEPMRQAEQVARAS
jgi:hypothetical protein